MTSIEHFLSKQLNAIVVHITDTYFIEENSINGQIDMPGFSRIYSLLHYLRNYSNTKRIPILVLHGGDFLFPSLMSNHFGGKQMIEILNACGFDYCILGNHDFDGGFKVLKKRLSEACFGVLCTNLRSQENKTFKTLSYKLWPDHKKAPQIAIVGISGKSTTRSAHKNGFDTSSVKSSLKKIIRELVQQHHTVTHLIVLSHMNNAEDFEIKRWLDHHWNGCVYVLGGHDHSQIIQYEKSENPRSILVKGQSNGRTIQIVGIPKSESTQKNTSTAKISSTIPNLRDHVYVMDALELSTFSPSPKIQNIVKKWERLLEKEINESKSDKIVKQFANDLVFDATELELRKGSTNFGNFVADCVLRYTDSDIVLINSGHFRGDRKIGNTLKLSDLKRIFVLSTKNRIIKTKMTCAECKEFLKHAYSEDGGRGKILQISKNATKLLRNSKDDEEFSVTMLYDMINADDDGFAIILSGLRNVTVTSLRKSLQKDILWDSDLLDMILHSSDSVKYDPSIRLSLKNFPKKL